jgi:restriction endonuclease
MLRHSDNTISRRQEVGRGLRLSVNQFGDRMDEPRVYVIKIGEQIGLGIRTTSCREG